jgi:hypothetical protein
VKGLGKRTPERQNDHDKCVKAIATKWKDEGWSVKADLEGWEKPSEIGGYIPDIEALKSITRICEVETEETLESDKDQWETFKDYCDEHSGYSFWLYIAEEGGKCRFKSV